MSTKKKTKECPSCAMPVDPASEVCPICQYEFPSRRPLQRWIILALAVLLLVIYVFF